MTFKFEPLPESELKNASYKDLKPGIASFKIIAATDKDKDPIDGSPIPLISRNGTHMMKVSFNITDCENNNATLYDYFHDKVAWKIHGLLKCVDRSVWYNSGSINPSELVGLFGQCILKEETGPTGKNIRISSYIEREKQEMINNQDDSDLGDIPF